MDHAGKYIVVTRDGDYNGDFRELADARQAALQWAADEEIDQYIYLRIGRCEPVSKARYIEENYIEEKEDV